MNRFRLGRSLAALLIVCGLALADRPAREAESESEGGPFPSDWFGVQRAFPLDRIPQEKVREAVEAARLDRLEQQLSTSTTTLLTWTNAGPYNVGGRVTALVAAPGGNPVYLGAANGGVFRSTNSGVNWTPVTDGIGYPSIGALAMDPNDPDVVYVGTGEANGAIDNYDGGGVWKTSDGGATWMSLGLAATARIGAIAVDPENPSRLFVAAMGTQFSTGPDRGLYRSENGGASWTRVLFVNDSTGVADVVVNPANPETVYCATWERIRRPSYRRTYGPGCGIWRSTNHGSTWTRLQSGLPAPSDDVGRIGLAIAPSRPSTVYAQIIGGQSLGHPGLGFYRTTNGGASWARRDGSSSFFTSLFSNFGWYFGEVAVLPQDPDVVFALGVDLGMSTDGGQTWESVLGTAHVDQHAMWVDPTNAARIYLGNDGGFYRTTTGAGNWGGTVDLPITQFYAGTIDPQNPARLYGGTQDNNTLRTTGSASGWTGILGGDGFQCIVDPTNSNIVIAEWQNCCGGTGPRRTTTGGEPWTMPSGFDGSDRYNWNTPIVMSPSNRQVVLCASQRVYRSTNNGVSYAAISPDLTGNPPASGLVFGTVTALGISPLDANLYYAGTDNGRMWRTTNAGTAWQEISAGLPVRYVTRVTPDPFAAGTVYATLSGFGIDEQLPHVYRSTNRGTSWAPIAAGLPDAPANDVLVDPSDPATLYLATDVGVYATRNQGLIWFPLGQGLPIQAVHDLTLHAPTRTLVAATHGRSQWKLDLTEMPLAVEPGPGARAGLALAPVAPNPSSGPVRLALELARAADVEVGIYDAQGRRVRIVASGAMPAGRHALAWDGADRAGRGVGAGVFFARAQAAGARAVQRFVRMR